MPLVYINANEQTSFELIENIDENLQNIFETKIKNDLKQKLIQDEQIDFDIQNKSIVAYKIKPEYVDELFALIYDSSGLFGGYIYVIMVTVNGESWDDFKYTILSIKKYNVDTTDYIPIEFYR